MTDTAFILRKSDGVIPVPEMIDRLSAIDPERISTATPWDVARTFHHLAQGVEFSLAGYPELKPALFRHTVGRVAFHVFQSRGHMRHATDAVIPGETVESGNPILARDRLLSSLAAFEATETLHPHFAYGALTKDQFAAAHVMHVADHIDDFRL